MDTGSSDHCIVIINLQFTLSRKNIPPHLKKPLSVPIRSNLRYLRRWRPSGTRRGVGLGLQVHMGMSHPCLHLKQQQRWQRFINTHVDNLLSTLPSQWSIGAFPKDKIRSRRTLSIIIRKHMWKKNNKIQFMIPFWKRQVRIYFTDCLNACFGNEWNIYCNDTISQYWSGWPTTGAYYDWLVVVFSNGKQDVHHDRIISIQTEYFFPLWFDLGAQLKD